MSRKRFTSCLSRKFHLISNSLILIQTNTDYSSTFNQFNANHTRLEYISHRMAN
jgi:hypothetical protein